jgi:hypothetical protein
VSKLLKLLRWILLSLLASLLVGFVLGTLLRARLEGPPLRYFVGAVSDSTVPSA